MAITFLITLLGPLPQLAQAQSTSKPTPVIAPSLPNNAAATAAQIEDLYAQVDKAERDKAIAEAKNEVIAAGNSRLENWIGIYGILIAVMLAGFGLATYRQAGAAAAKEVRSYKDEMDTLLETAKAASGKTVEFSEIAQAAMDKLPGAAPDTPLPPEQEAELANAARVASEKPRNQRTGQDFRLLLLQAEREEKWQEYVNLAEGMVYLHGENPDDLAFALARQALGHQRLENFELASKLWAEYLSRFPGIDPASRAAALCCWGAALSDQGERQQNAAAETLLSEAIEKFAAALAIKPDMHEAFNNWGAALSAQAKSADGDAGTALLNAAIEKYVAALAIKPDMHEALFNWGSALGALAKFSKEDVGVALLAAACEKYAAALAIKPDKYQALYNWANVLSKQAKTKQGDEATALFSAASDKYAAALAIKPDSHAVFYDWGCALLSQAESEQGTTADRLFAEAIEKYDAALTIKPDKHEALNNMGVALSEQAVLKQGEAADKLLIAASEKFAAAQVIKPDMPETLNNWGASLLVRAKLFKNDRRSDLVAQAEDKFRRAEALAPGSGAYNLACIHGLRRDAAGVAEWLRTAHKHNSHYPGCTHIAAEVDFDLVRDSPEFVAALADIGC